MKKFFIALASLAVVMTLAADTQSEWYASLSNKREATDVVVGKERWCPSVYKEQVLPYRFACGAVLNSTAGGKRLDLSNVTVSEGGIWADGDLAILLTGNNYVSGDISSNSGDAYYSLLMFGSGALTVNSSYIGLGCGGLSICAGPFVTILNGGVDAGQVLISMSSVVIQSSGSGLVGRNINILGAAVAIHSGSVSLGSGACNNIVIDGSVVSIMNDDSWRGVWADMLSVSHSYFSCVVPKDGWGCICASRVFFDNSIAKLYSKESSPLNDSYVGDVVFGEGDYYIASGSQAYTVGADGMAIRGGSVQICSANEGSSAVKANHFQIDSGRFEIVDEIDVRDFLKYDAAAAALYTGVVADGTIDVSSVMANFYSQVILDAISNAKIGNLNGVPNVGIDCGGSYYNTYTQNCGTVWCDLAKYGVMCYSPVVNGGSYKGQFYSPYYNTVAPLNSSGDSLKSVPYTVDGANKYDKITQSWNDILPSYYGTGSLYADAEGKLYFWIPEQNVPGDDSGGGGSGGGTDPTNMPDLVPYTPSGWSAPVVVARDASSTTDATGITSNDDLYLKFAVVCRGMDVTGEIYFKLYVDGAEKTSWRYEGCLRKDDYVSNTSAYALGKLSVGTHTFQIVVDSASAVAESDESNNMYVKTVTVGKASYVVTFDANGGTGGTTRIVDSGKEVGLLPVPERDGYAFAGWWTAMSGGSKIVETTTVTEETTYYAHWNYVGLGIDADDSYETAPNGTLALGLLELIDSASTPKITVKGLPTGLKYDAKTMTISGAATKPGVYKVTVSATNATVTKPVTVTFDIVVPNLVSEKLPGLEQETDAYGVVTCGVAFDPGLVDCSPEDGWTVKAAGLPTGLKFVQDKATGAYSITGVPTKPGTFTVTFTASKKGEKNQVATITLVTKALPEWAVGTFSGFVEHSSGAGSGSDFGSITMTVAANGKVSGKMALVGTNYTFSAASYATVDGEGCFVVEADAKAGKVVRPLRLLVIPYDAPESSPSLFNARAVGSLDSPLASEILMCRGMWKDKATAAAAKTEIAKWEGVYTLSTADGGYLSLTVGKDGNVKASGKLADGTSVSATTPLMYDGETGFLACLYSAPSAYKGGSLAMSIGFDEGEGGVRTLGNSRGIARWTSRNPQATGEYGEGFSRDVEFSGAYYDKGKKLNDYYEALRMSLDGAPNLGYVYKETDFNDLGRKVTVSEDREADAVDTLWQDGMTAAVNEKGAIVAEKATKPVQDKETKEWSYDGTNDGALTLSFTQATGIFKGSYTFWYDYMSAYDDTTGKSTMTHTSKKVSFEGIMVQGEAEMRGFYLWDTSSAYDDPKTGKKKTYKYKVSYPVYLANP